MKKFKILLLLLFLATGFTVNAMNSNNRNNSYLKASVPAPVGAPLDGGLLTVLGAGGIAYYIARRKGKKLES